MIDIIFGIIIKYEKVSVIKKNKIILFNKPNKLIKQKIIKEIEIKLKIKIKIKNNRILLDD